MKTYSKVLIALGAGAAAGAILGILFAPDKGSVTRKKLTDVAEDYTTKFRAATDNIIKTKVASNGHKVVAEEA